MVLTQERAREMTLRILENTRKMMEGDEGQAQFRLSADGKTAALMVATMPRHDDSGHMALMLAISERVAPIADAKRRFDAWADEALD